MFRSKPREPRASARSSTSSTRRLSWTRTAAADSAKERALREDVVTPRRSIRSSRSRALSDAASPHQSNDSASSLWSTEAVTPPRSTDGTALRRSLDGGGLVRPDRTPHGRQPTQAPARENDRHGRSSTGSRRRVSFHQDVRRTPPGGSEGSRRSATSEVGGRRYPAAPLGPRPADLTAPPPLAGTENPRADVVPQAVAADPFPDRVDLLPTAPPLPGAAVRCAPATPVRHGSDVRHAHQAVEQSAALPSQSSLQPLLPLAVTVRPRLRARAHHTAAAPQPEAGLMVPPPLSLSQTAPRRAQVPPPAPVPAPGPSDIGDTFGSRLPPPPPPPALTPLNTAGLQSLVRDTSGTGLYAAMPESDGGTPSRLGSQLHTGDRSARADSGAPRVASDFREVLDAAYVAALHEADRQDRRYTRICRRNAADIVNHMQVIDDAQRAMWRAQDEQRAAFSKYGAARARTQATLDGLVTRMLDARAAYLDTIVARRAGLVNAAAAAASGAPLAPDHDEKVEEDRQALEAALDGWQRLAEACPICYEPVVAADAASMPCNHTLHAHCAAGWAEACRAEGRVPNCPLCRGHLE